MASLSGAGESVAVVVGAGELGSATAAPLAGAGFTVVAVDHDGRQPRALAVAEPGAAAVHAAARLRRDRACACPSERKSVV